MANGSRRDQPSSVRGRKSTTPGARVSASTVSVYSGLGRLRTAPLRAQTLSYYRRCCRRGAPTAQRRTAPHRSPARRAVRSWDWRLRYEGGCRSAGPHQRSYLIHPSSVGPPSCPCIRHSIGWFVFRAANVWYSLASVARPVCVSYSSR